MGASRMNETRAFDLIVGKRTVARVASNGGPSGLGMISKETGYLIFKNVS